MIFLDEHHHKIIIDILKKYPYTFYAFGSRVKGTHRKLSDLDLCFKDAIPFAVQSQIAEEFEESNLPFEVDLVDWNIISRDFKEKIAKDLVLISPV